MNYLIRLTVVLAIGVCSFQQSGAAQESNERTTEEAIVQAVMKKMKEMKAQDPESQKLTGPIKSEAIKKQKKMLQEHLEKLQQQEQALHAQHQKLQQQELEQDEQLHRQDQQRQQQLQQKERQIEAWAEKYASQWDNWADRFENKMEHWAENQENQWEKWADEYSHRWEDWAEKIESGEIKPEEVGKLVDQNLELLSKMPMGTITEGLLKDGLSELENAPWEGLGDLHELVGGALEQSLHAMENEVAGKSYQEAKDKLAELHTRELSATLAKLQSAIHSQQHQRNMDGAAKVKELEQLLANSKTLEANEKQEIVQALKIEMEQLARQNQVAKQARAAAEKARAVAEVAYADAKKQQMAAKEKQLVETSRQRADEIAAQAKKSAAVARKLAKEAAGTIDKEHESMRLLERHYAELKEQKSRLEEKESDIESMRREIIQLRKEVEKMKNKEQKEKDKDE